MPTLNIEGRKVKVDDSFLKLSPADQQSTVEEIASQLGIKPSNQDAPVSGLTDQFLGGLESTTEQPGVSFEAGGKALGMPSVEGTGTWLRNLTSAPDNFVSATDRFIHPQQGDSYVDPIAGFGWGNAGGMVAENAGMLAGSLASKGAGAGIGAGVGAVGGAATGSMAGGVGAIPGAVAGAVTGAGVGALAGPAIFGFVSTIGPVALARAQADGREEPNWKDWSIAAGAAGAAGALETFGIGRIGILNSTLKDVAKTTTKDIVKTTGKDIAKNAGREFVSGAGQSVVQQAGQTVGTDGGLKIDLKEAVGQGIGQAGAGGLVDAAVRVPRVQGDVRDSMAIDRAVSTDPFARDAAEITQSLNDTTNGPARRGVPLTPGDLGSKINDLKSQFEEAINGQNLDAKDKKALINGVKNAKGLDEKRLNEIAGRSDSPDEIKAMVRKIQVARAMTVQKQTAKGFRGAMAGLAYHGGSALGGAIGSMTGTPQGAAAGSYIGDRIGTSIARRLRGNQTQGNNIDKLVGKTQARRAQMLLDRYGPSDATLALNTLTEKAAANKAQAEAEAQAKKDAADNFRRMQEADRARKEARQAEEAANTREEKAKARAKRDEVDLKTRETRLKGLAIGAEQRRVRLEMMANKLESEKSTNALRIEKAQAERDLANARAQGAAHGQILDLSGKLLKLADDIKLREQALARASAMTKRAEKLAERVPESKKAAKAAATQTARRYANMTSEQMSQVEVDQFGNPIRNRAQFRMKAEEIQKLQADGLVDAVKFDDKRIGNLFIEAIGDFKNATGHKNQSKRMAIYRRVMEAVPPDNLDAHRFIAMYIRPLAMAFEAQSGDPNSFGPTAGREDFGEDPPF